MRDSPHFVQFPHPGSEHKPDFDGGKDWLRRADTDGCGPSVRCSTDHARKFMQVSGQWLEEDHKICNGELWTWGEWEAQSDLLRTLDQPGGDRDFPRYLWRPYYILPPHGYRGLHNTDPFIFGERFLYSNCRQASRPGLMNLDRGSVIVFGSDKSGAWVLDTVLVVAGSVEYMTDEAPHVLADWAPQAFLHVTAGPLAANDSGRNLRLYQGATPSDPIDEMFSFFPAMPADDDIGFKRPSIRLPAWCFTQNLRMTAKQKSDVSRETLHGLWESLVEQVREAGLALGTHAAVPERRPA